MTPDAMNPMAMPVPGPREVPMMPATTAPASPRMASTALIAMAAPIARAGEVPPW
jgi:hypothetical protein